MPEPSSVLAARILVVASDEDRAAVEALVARAGAAATPPKGADAAPEPALTLVPVTSRVELDAALAAPMDAVVWAASAGPELALDAVIAACRRANHTPAVIGYAAHWSDAAFQAAVTAGADDFVSGDDGVRFGPALARELRRARRRKAEVAPSGPGALASLLQAVVDALPFVLFVKDEELRLCIVNQTLCAMFGFTKEGLLGKTDHEYFPKEQADAIVALDREVLATRQMRELLEEVPVGGTHQHFATRKVPVLDGDGRLYLLGVTENVTARRDAEDDLKKSKADLEAANQRLEQNLLELKKSRAISARTLASYQQRALQMEIIRQQNEDLDRLAQDLAKAKRLEEQRAREIEQAARLKSEFLANFSHEIRTPLNGILGYVDLLAREEGSRLTPHGRRDLQVVKANAKTLLALINDILDLSKIEAGHVDVVRERVDVAALCDECIATVRDYLQGKNVEVTASIAPDTRALETDALKLRQILLNLLSNAAKFTHTGEIVVEVSRKDDRVVIVVEDTGDGIPPDQLPFIFEKFRQVDGSSTRKVGGTGLGLAIVRELCRVLEGTVEATSQLGRGSRFTVVLPGLAPVTAVPSAAGHAGPETKERPTGARVLVVDDDPLVHQLLKAELEREGMRVLLATDGIEALTLARRHKPSAIVLDIHLPKLDGWTVLAELKGDPGLSHIPIIIVPIEEQRAKGFSLGACEYLVKPVDPERLVAIVSRSVTPGGGEVLIVDDDPATRELVSRQLRSAGFATAEARDGEEALLRARVTQPALVVLDSMMPGLNGFEVARQMRAEQIATPIVVLTAKTLTREEQQLLRDNIAAVVQKNGTAIETVVAEAKRLVVEHGEVKKLRLPRVLYVEDSAQNRDVVRRYLYGTFEVLEAEDGEHGLDRAQRDLPDLILMDLSLPRLDGWEATRRLKAGPHAAIPVIALTAHASREDQARARAAGCDGYLTKPVDREVLVNTIRKHLSTRATPPPPPTLVT